MSSVHKRILFVLTLLITVPEQLWAATTEFSSDTTNYLRFLWGLLVVLGIIYILYGLLRKRFSLLTTGKNERIKILEMKPLGGRRAICLVEVRNRQYLLGVCDQSISHLASFDPTNVSNFPEALAEAEAEVQP